MHPSAVVEEALSRGLDIIAISDHNSSENVCYVMEAARGKTLTIIPGMEVTTREEVHVLSLFDSLAKLREFQEYVYANLEGKNDEDVFGIQAIVNELGEVEGFNEHMLIGATKISIEDLAERVHGYGGLVIPAHIDRQSFSIIGQLGFVPPDVPFDALEISWRLGIAKGRERFPELSRYPFVTSSDAHFIRDIAQACTIMYLEEPSLGEIRKALRKEDGRYIEEVAC